MCSCVRVFVCSCYADFVLKNVTITLSPEAALWARKQAAEKNTSVSRFVGQMIEEKMGRDEAYWAAYRRWKSFGPLDIDAANRLTREEANERPR